MASDISEEAVRLADENLSLLHKNGLERRMQGSVTRTKEDTGI